MTEPNAKVIADSISRDGQRLTTLEVTFPRIILAEMNTHRQFSRNSASSRAIPFAKQVKRIETDPFYPLVWATEQSGMQGGEPLSDADTFFARQRWDFAARDAIRHAQVLADLGVHKSIVNRLIEPFAWHTAIISSTEWNNFFIQRCSPLAQPEMRVTAEAMRDALAASTPRPVLAGDWHMPYVDSDDYLAVAKMVNRATSVDELLRRVSTARCARVSYLTHDGKRDIQVDLDLYDKLVSASPPHLSPLEHVATPRIANEYVYGNFDGWHQLRHLVLEDADA